MYCGARGSPPAVRMAHGEPRAKRARTRRDRRGVQYSTCAMSCHCLALGRAASARTCRWTGPERTMQLYRAVRAVYLHMAWTYIFGRALRATAAPRARSSQRIRRVPETSPHKQERNIKNTMDVGSIARFLRILGSHILGVGLIGLGVACAVDPITAATMYFGGSASSVPASDVKWVHVAVRELVSIGRALSHALRSPFTLIRALRLC